MFLDDWQQWCVEQIFGEDESAAAIVLAVVLILPRQNGKNAILEAIELYALYVLGEQRILHTAHLGKTAADHMRRMVSLVKANPELDAITYVYWSNGKEALERTDTGARLEFITRGRKTARGGSPRRVIFDEALFLTDDQIQAILPALSAQSLSDEGPPQIIYTSSAPIAESLVLHRLRKLGQSGGHKRMFYAEWGNEPGTAVNDKDAWYRANPGLGIRISEEWIESQEMPPMMSDEAFSIERLGVPQDPIDANAAVKIPPAAYAATAITPEGAPKPDGSSPIVFDVTPNGTHSTVGWAAGTLSDPYVEAARHEQGTQWVPGQLVRMVKALGSRRVAWVSGSPAESLVTAIRGAFRDAGIDPEILEPMTRTEYAAACQAFYSDIVEAPNGRPRLRRVAGQVPLDSAVAIATERTSGEGWVWDRKTASVPLSPLVAVTVARALLAEKEPGKPVFW